MNRIWVGALLAAAVCGLSSNAIADKPPTSIRLLESNNRVELSEAGKARLKNIEVPSLRVISAHSTQLADFDPSSLSAGDRILVEIAPGEPYDVVLERAGEGYGGFVELIGSVAGFPDSSFQLVVKRTGADAGADGQLIFGGRSIGIFSEQAGTTKVLIVERVESSDEGPAGQRPWVIDSVGTKKPTQKIDKAESESESK